MMVLGAIETMPTEPPFPTEEAPGVWRTRWRSDLINSKRYMHVQRFYGNRTAITREFKRWLKAWRLDEAMQNPRAVLVFSVADLCVSYLAHAEKWYVKNDRPTSHIWNVRGALQRLTDEHGDLAVNAFTPQLLAAYRNKFDTADAKRKTVNGWLTIIRQAFNWGSEQGLVDPDVALRLTTVKLLQSGRCAAGEYEIREAVHWTVVSDTLPCCSKTVKAMVEIQYHAAMRPGEVCIMRGCDIDTSGEIWLYKPVEHKTEHHGKSGVIALGPNAQKIIAPFLKTDLAAYLFTPRASSADQGKGVRSNMGDCFTTNSYRRAITRACDRAFPPPAPMRQRKSESAKAWGKRIAREGLKDQLDAWRLSHRWTPHQLRHAREAMIEKQESLEAAKRFLRHSGEGATREYGQKERELRELEQYVALARKHG